MLLAALAAVAASAAALAVRLVGASDLVDALSGRPLLGAAALVVGVPAAVAGAWLLVRRPWLLAFAALAAAPVRVPARLGSQEAFLLLPLYAVVGCAWLALAFEVVRGREPRRPLLPRAVGLPLGLFVVLAAASLAWSEDERQGSVTFLFFLLPFGVLAAALGRLEPRRAELGRLAALDVALAAVFAAIGLWQWFTRTTAWDNPKLEVSNLFADFHRVNGIFFDPSVYGRFLAVALVVVAGAALLGRPSRPLLLVGVAGFVWLGLLVSFSQSSFTALAVGLLALIALGLGPRTAVVLVAGLLVVGALALLTPPLASVRHALERGDAGSVTSARSGPIETGIDLLADHPVAGVGLGGFLAAGKPEQDASARGAKGASHSTPVTVGAELGIAGLALLLWLAVALGRLTLRPPGRAVRELRPARLIVAVALLAVFVHALFYAAFFEDPLTWGLIALLAVVAVPVGAPGRVRRA